MLMDCCIWGRIGLHYPENWRGFPSSCSPFLELSSTPLTSHGHGFHLTHLSPMDPSDPSKDRSEEENRSESESQAGGERGDQRSRKRSSRILIRCFVSFCFSVVGSFLLSLLVGIAALSIGNLSASTSVSVPSTCKILSSSEYSFS